MNEKVFNDPKAPLYIISHTSVMESVFGNVFMTTSGVQTSGGASQIMLLVLTNPPGSGVRALVDLVDMGVNSSTLAVFTIRFNGTVSGVLPVPAYNLNTGVSHSPACTAAAGGGAGVSITGGQIFWTDYPDVAETYYPMAIVLTQGNSLAISYTFSSSGNSGAFSMRWYEIPLDVNSWL